MDAETLRSIVVYEEDTGILRWRNDNKTISWIKAGDIVGGGSKKNGYLSTSIRRKQYYQHRLVWLYVYGEWPAGSIDHINGDRSDNRIVNLRLATASENQHNRKKTKNRDTPVGAYKHYRGTWYSSIMVNKVKKYLGSFKTAEEAAEAYAKAKKELHLFNPDVPNR
jgi:hypothetical protein